MMESRDAETTEFLGASRCEACVKHNRKCWIRQDLENGCLVCSSTEERCIFTRTVKRTAFRTEFTWEQLIEKNDYEQSETPLQ